MKKKNFNAVIVTATAKGVVFRTDNPQQQRFERYDESYQNKSENYNNKIKKLKNDIHLNMVQQNMYDRLMFGLTNYSKEEIFAISNSELSKIVEDHKKAKRAIHVLKAKKLFSAETKLIAIMTNKPNFGKNDYDWYIDIPKQFTITKMKITVKEIVEDFMRRKLLPKNFLEISPITIKL